MTSTLSVAHPFVKMAGGKTKLLPELLARVPPKFGAYHEPFVGGGALFWALQNRITSAVVSDLNKPLVVAYRAVQVDVEGLIRKLRRMKNDPDVFARVRAKGFNSDDVAEIGARAIYLNKTCYNGLWRMNRKGQFNAPFGRYKNPAICVPELLRACHDVLARPGIKVRHEGFEGVLHRAKKGDFVYFDPPYLPRMKDFASYTEHPFGIEQHVQLRDVARELKKRKVHVMISNSNHEAVRDLYTRGFEIEEVMAPRSINSNPDDRGLVAELLIR